MDKKSKTKIKTVLETMEYEQLAETDNVVKEWLAKQNNTIHAYGAAGDLSGNVINITNINSGEKLAALFFSTDKDYITNLFHEKNKWNIKSNFGKTKLMKKFAAEIKQNEKLICGIESCARGLLVKDTKKYGISLLIDCLEYFASWTFSSTTTSHEPCIIYADSNTCLGILGFALGPALAHGSTIILHVDPTLSVAAALLIELSIKAGIPDGVINLLPSLDELWMPKDSAIIYLFGNLSKEKFQTSAFFKNKQVIALPNTKIPMIIFNNADIDSACEYAIAAIWEYEGMLPWSVDTILVQEDVYNIFIKKLKQNMTRLRVGKGNDQQADISYPQPKEIDILKEVINDARAQGIDIYQPYQENGNIYPTLFIGAKVYANNVLFENKNISPAPSVLAFRSPKEAAALANNSRQGFAASVWSENISLVNEVTKLLNVGTVWINTYGIVKPYISFTTYKLDGVGYVGGSLGFYEFEDQSNPLVIESVSKVLSNVVTIAQKAQNTWNLLPIETRIEKLYKWASDVNDQNLKIATIPNVDDLTAKLSECITRYTFTDATRTIENFSLTIKREAIGVVILFAEDSIDLAITLGSLLLGNAVILVTKNTQSYDSLCKCLSPGVLTVANSSEMPAIINNTQTNPRVIFIGDNIKSIIFQKCYKYLHDWDFILRRCSLLKNIWSAVGDSV